MSDTQQPAEGGKKKKSSARNSEARADKGAKADAAGPGDTLKQEAKQPSQANEETPSLAEHPTVRMLLKPWVLGVAGALLGLGIGFTTSAAPAVLTLTGLMIFVAVFAVWQSVRMLTGDVPVPEDMALVKLGRRGALAERKRTVLRALKDLENERAIGKIEADDFDVVAARYREEAKGIMRAMDEEVLPYRQKAEAMAQEHLRRAGLLKDDTRGEDDARGERSDDMPRSTDPKRGTDAEARVQAHVRARVCNACETVNEADAKFCKNCAAPLAEPKSANAMNVANKSDASEGSSPGSSRGSNSARDTEEENG
jgi:hypothetical protein